ncbi:hypothetical protein BCR33DRAFT_771083 [Rhizoclosmatium globosum]|uniref:Uncharacterized protein n=1 Tax=Rhizoclosmatium globosum TaxID=329046 RepID=A0A1Y2BGL6_9FUNG|nr:hypothetical protein BCR33DRAFT_771083 [Rhizoclosmatium globosum]|eukprot:ORY33866.1 hypothetical protein BCR33DRAFT_771083 [Rhizoclosmatium globosum]
MKALEAENSLLHNKYTTLLQEASGTSHRIHTLEVENATLRGEVEGLVHEQGALVRINRERENDLEKLETEQLEWKAREQELVKEIKNLKTEIKNLKSSQDQSIDTAAATRIYVEELKLAKKQAENEASRSAQEVLELRGTVDRLMMEAADREREIDAMQSSCETVADEENVVVECGLTESAVVDDGNVPPRNSLSHEEETGDEAASEATILAENAALRDEVTGLTEYINKLIFQLNEAGVAEYDPNSADTVSRSYSQLKAWRTLGIRNLSGSSLSSKDVEPMVLGHKEWAAKEGVRKMADDGVMVTVPLVDAPKKKPSENNKAGVLSSLSKTIGSWYGSAPVSHANAKPLNPTVADIQIRGVPKSDIQVNSLADALNAPKLQELQRLEKAAQKVGFRQSRILENKRVTHIL